jgi:outer membrane protein assembly factor BamB
MKSFRLSLLPALMWVHVAGGAMPLAERVVQSLETDRGLCVVLGGTDCRQAIELAPSTKFTVYTQFERPDAYRQACVAVEAAGYYGGRIFVGLGDLKRLHLGDNLADAVVILDRDVETPQTELSRVLRPGGKLMKGQEVSTKPFPRGVDDWSHPYHGPDNNPQSRDKVVVAPYLTQFLAEPRYAPLPQVAVASAGRVFKAFGHVAFKVREEPFLNKLVAFNGYNGTILWQRDLREGVMIHRNTMIATPTLLYVGDDESCKVIDAATGKLVDEIIPPTEVAGGTFWKWMALEGGVLYAMMGEQEQRDPTRRWKREKHGWPWAPISKGFNQPDQPWGYGRNVLAIDAVTKEVLWRHHEEAPTDGRAICMKNGRIYLFRFGRYLTCLDARTGGIVWRRTPDTAPRLFAALGEYLNRQDWRTNWRTTCYLKCSDDALYFAGPAVGKLLAVSARDGSVLWQNEYSNFQLVLRQDGLYGLSGQIDKHPSKKFDPLTGEVLAEFTMHRRACTRPNGSADAIFCRAEGGSIRLDVASHRPQWVSPMRPNCHDGVTIANGLLYWWPSVCDCQLTLYGVTCLGPADQFDFTPAVDAADRFVRGAGLQAVAELPVAAADWPTFRADNACRATTSARVSAVSEALWNLDLELSTPPGLPRLTAPVTAGGLVLVGGADGIVRAIETSTGRLAWKAHTGGAIRMPPTIWQGRAYVGSGDGWLYALEARTGRLLWKFRAAAAERRIPVYSVLMSNWPVASGVLVDDGTAYCAAGIANFDGTYVYALDARTGQLKWHNSTSGHLDPHARTGVSVQGHLLLHEGKLYLPGGTSVSPAVYDAETGHCLNEAGQLAECVSRNPRGWELSLLADHVVVCGKPFYGHPAYDVYDNSVFGRVFLASAGGNAVVWASEQYKDRMLGFAGQDGPSLARKLGDMGDGWCPAWAKIAPKDKPAWAFDCERARAVAACANAAMVATDAKLLALHPASGEVLWEQALPASPVRWGLAVDATGRAVVSLEDGRVLCFGRPGARALAADVP